jgi:hypothetical protein
MSADKKVRGGVEALKSPTVEYTYWRTENLQSPNVAMFSHGSINDRMRYIFSHSNEDSILLIFIPLGLKLGTHKWKKSDGGIRVRFEHGGSYPGYGSWDGEWGEITILDDNFRDFKGTFSVYSKNDGSPPRLDQGRFWVKFENQGE